MGDNCEIEPTIDYPATVEMLRRALAEKDEENARLEALLTRKDEEYAWTISPAMASARIDELNTQMVTLSDVLRTIRIMCAPHSSVLARDICRVIEHTLKEAS